MHPGKNIRFFRKNMDKTIQDLALAIGSDPGNVSRLERGEQGFSLDLLENIANELNVELYQLFMEDINKTTGISVINDNEQIILNKYRKLCLESKTNKSTRKLLQLLEQILDVI